MLMDTTGKMPPILLLKPVLYVALPKEVLKMFQTKEIIMDMFIPAERKAQNTTTKQIVPKRTVTKSLGTKSKEEDSVLAERAY